MAEAIKSALLVDYESLHRSLTGGSGDSRLADRAAAWVEAIESGSLLGPKGRRRHLVTKRVYAGPNTLGKQRDNLAAAGFDVVDVGADARGSADMHMAMDAVDALVRADGCDEFILLSAAGDLAPLVTRLKTSKRLTAIYADAATPEATRLLADSVLDGTDLAIVLSEEDTQPGRSGKNSADRASIETFARRIHAATNIPLFSPKTFAELFRHLTDEITENGYHFQTSAKNVADRMTAAGRNVNRRQVVFIVKGLALKGHVFSTTDTPARLAEVFREQARYLITNAGITLDEREDELLTAWFAGATIQPGAVADARPAPKPVPAQAKPQAPPAPATAEMRPPAPPPERPKFAAKPTASARPPPVRAIELPKSTAAKPVARPIPAPPKPSPSPVAREEARAVIAARIAGAAKMKPGASRPQPKAAPRPTASSASQGSRPANDPLESSILAAIAEAVDVLVDDDTDIDEAPATAMAPPAPEPDEEPEYEQEDEAEGDNDRRPVAAQAAPRATAQAANGFDNSGEDDAESGDIGDQIQRIIASYNRNRTDE